MTKGRLMVCPGEVEVTVHEPVPTHGLRREDVHGLSDQVRSRVASAQ